MSADKDRKIGIYRLFIDSRLLRVWDRLGQNSFAEILHETDFFASTRNRARIPHGAREMTLEGERENEKLLLQHKSGSS